MLPRPQAHGAGEAVPGLRLAVEALGAPAMALVETVVLVAPIARDGGERARARDSRG